MPSITKIEKGRKTRIISKRNSDFSNHIPKLIYGQFHKKILLILVSCYTTERTRRSKINRAKKGFFNEGMNLTGREKRSRNRRRKLFYHNNFDVLHFSSVAYV